MEKYNFGRDKTKFQVVVLGGKGIHHGLSAMYDCKMLKLASFGKSITMNGVKYGSMRTIVAKAHAGEDEFFQPFIDALKDPSKIAKIDTKEEEEVWEGDE